MKNSWHICITTTDRPVSTAEESVVSLARSGYSGSLEIIDDSEARRGCFLNYAWALSAATKSGARIVGVLPDDYEYLTPGWPELIEDKVMQSDVGFVAIYLPKGVGHRHGFAEGWNKLEQGWGSSWGTSYIMRREVALEVATDKLFVRHGLDCLTEEEKAGLVNYEWNKRIDHLIPEIIHRHGLKQYFYAPSIVRHIGKTSTIGHRHTVHEDPFLR